MAVLAVATMGCAQIPDPVKRKDLADGFATQNNWVAKLVHTDSFAIQTYVPKETEHNRRLVIYFEGDGLAWLSSTRPSSDPSPLDPVGLQMAMAHTGQQARAYVARPCQYVLDPLCRQKHWTGHRFSKEVIDSTAQVVDERKRRTGASRLVLVARLLLHCLQRSDRTWMRWSPWRATWTPTHGCAIMVCHLLLVP